MSPRSPLFRGLTKVNQLLWDRLTTPLTSACCQCRITACVDQYALVYRVSGISGRVRGKVKVESILECTCSMGDARREEMVLEHYYLHKCVALYLHTCLATATSWES